jgi:uncharacterized protein YkwD
LTLLVNLYSAIFRHNQIFMLSLKRVLSICFLLVPLFSAFGQTVYDEETKLVELLNELRVDPGHFLHSVVMPYIVRKGMDTVDNKYVASLIADLRKQPGTMPLTRDPYLTRKARVFAKDMGSAGAVGHTSKKLGGLSTRLKGYKNKYIGENCSYGYSRAVDIIMQLLIDEDVPSLGHRRNILNAKYKRIGVAIEGHKKYNWNCVMDFGG